MNLLKKHNIFRIIKDKLGIYFAWIRETMHEEFMKNQRRISMKKTTVSFWFRRNIIRYVTGSCKCSQLCIGTAGNAKAYIRGSASIVGNGVRTANDPGGAGWGGVNPLFEETFALFKDYYGEHCQW